MDFFLFFLIIFFLINFYRISNFDKDLIHNNKKKRFQIVSLEHDQAILEKNLNNTIIHSRDWQNFKNFSIPIKELVNLNNANEFFELSKTMIADLSLCLKKNYCGMERRNENDSYFDNQRTPGHILLERSLAILSESLTLKPSLSQNLDWELLDSLTQNENESIKVESLKLINRFHADIKNQEKILRITEKFSGKSKADGLVEVSNSTRLSRNDILESIANSFSFDDPHTVISIIEKLELYHLTKNEFEKISPYLCRFKSNDKTEIEESPNWKMIKFDLGKFNINLEEICQNT
jgi:hypothetical protein